MEIAHSTVNNWHVAQLSGPFTIQTLRVAQETIDTIAQNTHPLLALNLTDVSYIDSSAIGVILAANRNFTQKGGYIALFGANPTITEVFNTIKLSKHIPVYGDYNAFVAAT